MTYTIKEVEEGPPGGAKVAVRFTGDDLTQLGLVSDVTIDEMKKIPQAVDVRSDYRNLNPEIIVEPYPEVVGLFGMTEMQVAQAIQTAINGDTTIELNLGDEDVTLRLQALDEYRQSKNQLERIMLTSPTGKKATIGQLADLPSATSLLR